MIPRSCMFSVRRAALQQSLFQKACFPRRIFLQNPKLPVSPIWRHHLRWYSNKKPPSGIVNNLKIAQDAKDFKMHDEVKKTADDSTKIASNPNSPSNSTSHTRAFNPTKEQLLAKATNFFSRLRIRFKWLMKRSNRPFNTDDYSALFSWLVMGNALLFFLATTTFFSLVILTANTVLAQEFVARKLGEFITKNSNLTVVFEHAIVPGWSDGKISFRKCFVSKRPKVLKRFIKGSLSEAYAASLIRESDEEEMEPEDDGNYAQYDLTIEEVNISLSFKKWVNGTGIVETMEIKGLRGVVDRTHVHWDPDDDARNYKNVYHPGDFELEDFKMEDVLFKLKQPNHFREFDVAIYNCELTRLRKHWLFYDLLNANIMSGSYDNLLFTIHKKQRLDDFKIEETFTEEQNRHNGVDAKDALVAIVDPHADVSTKSKFQRITRLRVDSLNVDHLNTGLEGPFGWITHGKVDMIGDLMVPKENNDFNVSELVLIIAESIRKEATRYRNPAVVDSHAHLAPPNASSMLTKEDILKYFVLDITIKLNNVKASVPFQTPELSYINYALIRPIVAYINLKNTFIEIHNRVVKNLEDFSGSWTIYDSLLMDDISTEVYDNFVDYVANEEARLVRMKKFGFWSLQLLLQLMVFGLGLLT